MKTLSIFLLICGGMIGAAKSPAAALHDFPRPAQMEPAVQFWIKAFSEWEENQIVFFDGRDLDRIYEIHRLPPSNGTLQRERKREAILKNLKKGLQNDLKQLAQDDTDFDNLDPRLYRLFQIWGESRDHQTYGNAAKNLRRQKGARESFSAGVGRSLRYINDFKMIFREEGLPEELAYLPHVESAFRWNARSGVGAVGMWQFMPATGRKYLVVDPAVDERLDPYTAARAAARYLKMAYENLGNWPLAITSYNHGVDGILNAAHEVRSYDLTTIVENYDGPLFGFAGRNFYPEFLAAIEASEIVLRRPEAIEIHKELSFDAFHLPAYVKINTLLDAFDISREGLSALNPSVTKATWRGDYYLSSGMNLKLPPGKGSNAEEVFASIAPSKRPTKRPRRTYRVRSGDNLGLIAARHKTSVKTLQRLNGIRNANRLRAGTVLKLPQ